MLFICNSAGTHMFQIASDGLQLGVKRRVLERTRHPFTLQNLQCSTETMFAFSGSAHLRAPPHSRNLDNRWVLDMKRRHKWPTESHVVHGAEESRPQTCRPRRAALIDCVAGTMELFCASSCFLVVPLPFSRGPLVGSLGLPTQPAPTRPPTGSPLLSWGRFTGLTWIARRPPARLPQPSENSPPLPCP